MKKTTIVMADDHPVVRMGVRGILKNLQDFSVVGEASDGEEALAQIAAHNPDILLLDLSMPKLPGIETLRELTHRTTAIKTILLTAQIEKQTILEALQLGARGVVLKDAVTQDLVECLRTVRDGKYWIEGKPVQNLVQIIKDLMVTPPPEQKATFGLTPRELEIVGLIVQGCTNKEVASQCGITDETVKRHLKNTFDKLGVSSRLELAMYAINHHLVEN